MSICSAINSVKCQNIGLIAGYITYAYDLRSPDEMNYDSRIQSDYTSQLAPELGKIAIALQEARTMKEQTDC